MYGDISETSWWGDEVTPKQFAAELGALDAASPLTVRINSGGGDVFAAAAIGNLLEGRSGEVTAHIDGLCASAATIVACHCGKVVAAKDSTYMIHPVRVGVGYATADELQQYLDAVKVIRESIVGLYAKKTGREKDEVAALMDATSWWTSEQAKEQGFVDELDEGGNVAVENRAGLLFVNSVSTGLAFDEAPKFVQDSLKAAPAANCVVNKTPAGTPENNGHKEGNQMTVKDNATTQNAEQASAAHTAAAVATTGDLRKLYPDLMAQAEREVQNAASEAERARLQAIDEVADVMPPELVAQAKYGENACEAKELTYRAAVEAKKQGHAYIAAAHEDAESSGANGVKAAPVVVAEDETKLTESQRMEKARAAVKGLLGKKEG